jgi:hypothetical protein
VIAVGLFLCTFLSIALMAAGYSSAGMDIQTFGLVAVGLVWMIGQVRWTWVATIGLSLMTLAAALGMMYGLPMSWMVGGFLFALISWDLVEFRSRIKQGSEEDPLNRLALNHFIRLRLVLILGFGVLALTRFIRLRFNFEMAALLALVGVWGISLLVGRLRSRE